MEVFLSSIINYPTIIYTGCLAILCVSWLLTIFGMLDFEAFDIDIDIDMDAEASDLSGFAGLLVTWGLAGVPLTLSFSILFLYAWVFSYLIMIFAAPLMIGMLLKLLIGSVILVVTFAVSVVLTAKTIKPFCKFFDSGSTAPIHHSLMGEIVTIRSTRVNSSFGEATHEKDGTSLILKVRSDVEYMLKKGDRAVISEYLEDTNSYYVTPEST
jgi:hypothetical protein